MDLVTKNMLHSMRKVVPTSKFEFVYSTSVTKQVHSRFPIKFQKLNNDPKRYGPASEECTQKQLRTHRN